MVCWTTWAYKSCLVCVCMCAKSLQSCLIHCNPMNCSPPGSSVHGISRKLVAMPSSGDLPNPGIELRSPLQVNSLPSEPPGKPTWCPPGRLQSMGSRRVSHNWVTSLSFFTFMHWRRKWQPTRVLAWTIPGTVGPGGLPSMGLHRVGHDWSDLAVAAATCDPGYSGPE